MEKENLLDQNQNVRFARIEPSKPAEKNVDLKTQYIVTIETRCEKLETAVVKMEGTESRLGQTE